MNYTIENDTLTIIQDIGSQKTNTTHELGYGVQIMETIRNEIKEYTDTFQLDRIPEALERLEEYRPMYEACKARLHEIEIEQRDARLAAEAELEAELALPSHKEDIIEDLIVDE